MAYEPETSSTPTCDLDKLRKTALTKRELAWDLLKQTRNPLYVSMRYDFPLETMEKALESIPEETPIYKRFAEQRGDNSVLDSDSSVKRPGELLQEITREPGEDDDLET